MCIQVVERYGICGCLYYKHQVDACPNYRKRGHDVRSSEVAIGYTCPKHSSSTLYRQPIARARRQAREKYQSDTPLRLNRTPVYTSPERSDRRATDRSDDGQVLGSDGSFSSLFHSCHVSDPTDTDHDRSNEVVSCRPLKTGIVDVGQRAVDIHDPVRFHHSQSEVQIPSTWTAPPGEIDSRHASSPGENTCPHHLLQSVDACTRECGWNIEQTIERGDTTTDISRKQLHQILRDSLIFAFANLPHSIEPTAVTQSSDPCRGTNNHTITGTVELVTLQSNANPEALNSRTPQLPTASSDNLNAAEYPSITTCDTRKTKQRASIPPCYLLIFLGLLTVIGSLLPGLWRASLRNDLSGGFTLAQYILGVGIFVVGSMVAIHSKTCECWKTHNRVGQVVVDGH